MNQQNEQYEQEQEQERVKQQNLEETVTTESGQETSSDLIRTINQSGVRYDMATEFETLLSPDFIMANFEKRHIHKLEYDIENDVEIFKGVSVPRDSIATGQLAELIYGKKAIGPLSEDQQLNIQRAKLAVLARITRGKDGFQQDKLQHQTKQITSISNPQDVERKKGFLDKLMG